MTAARVLPDGDPMQPGIDGPRLTGYRFSRLLGSGGMGTVHLAWDETLGRQVAIKTLAEKFKAGSAAEARFIREARAMATIEHPGVVRIYTYATENDRAFIIMEYVKGETLSTHIAGRAPLPVDEALRIVRQVTQALEAAWERGIVHRDIKPSNILIDQRHRVRVADFGLAKTTVDIDSQALTVIGSFQGTPDYVSPEQARGQPVDWRSDIYSLSVVLFEMLTGELPFRGSPLEIVNCHVEKDFPDLAEHAPDLPSEVPKLVKWLSQKDRDKRPGSYQDLMEVLNGLIESSSTSSASLRESLTSLYGVISPQPWRRLAWLVGGVFAVLAILVAITWWVAGRTRPLPPPIAPTTVSMRQSIAVLGFKNLSKREEDNWLSTAFSEMLYVELAAGGKLRAIASEDVARAKMELALPDGETLAPDTLAKVRSRLGADYLVLGSYLVVHGENGKLRLNLNLQDAATGVTIGTSETSTVEGILDIVSKMGGKLHHKLGTGAMSEADTSQARAALPEAPEAIRHYSQGLESMRSHQYMAAKDLFILAIAEDPNKPLAHAALAEAWSALAYDGRAREEAAAAVQLAENLSREERLSVEGRDHEISKRWDQAIRSYRALFEFFPDNIDYGLRLARSLVLGGRGQEAIVVTDSLRQLPGTTAASDVRITLAEARTAAALSDYRGALEASTRAIEKGAQGAKLATAHLARGRALVRLGRPGEANTAIEMARSIYVQEGDRGGETKALNRLAGVAYEEGNYLLAQESFEQVLEIWEDVGSVYGIAAALNDLAHTLWIQGKLTAAKPLFERGIEMASAQGDDSLLSQALTSQTELFLHEGVLSSARQTGEEGLRLAQSINNDYGTYCNLTVLANIAYEAGDLQSAAAYLEQGLELAQARGDRPRTARLLFGLGDLAKANADFRLAREHHEDVARIRQDLGNKITSAHSQVALALLSVEEDRRDRLAADLTGLEQVILVFSDQDLPQGEAKGWSVLAVVALANGLTDQAAQASKQARQLLARCESVLVKLRVRIRLATCDAALGQADRAIADLEAVIVEARAGEMVLIEYEARLALAEIRARQPGASAEDLFAPLVEDARARKFLLIAQRAAAGLKPVE